MITRKEELRQVQEEQDLFRRVFETEDGKRVLRILLRRFGSDFRSTDKALTNSHRLSYSRCMMDMFFYILEQIEINPVDFLSEIPYIEKTNKKNKQNKLKMILTRLKICQ